MRIELHVLRDTVMYALGSAITKAALVLAMPIYTRLFPPAEYGAYNFVVTGVGLALTVLGFGVGGPFGRFFFRAQDDSERRLVATTWIAFLAAWLSLLALIVLPFSGILSSWTFGRGDRAALIAIAIATLPVTAVNSVCAVALRNQFKARQFIGLNILGTSLEITVSLISVLVLKLGLAGILLGALVGGLMMLPLRLWMIRPLLGRQVSLPLLRRQMLYGTGLMLSGVAYWLFSASDRLLLGELSSMKQVGLYSVAATLANTLWVVLDGFGLAWTPHVLRLYELDRDRASIFAGRVATYLLIAFGLLAVFVITFSDEVIALLASSAYKDAATVVEPLALGILCYSMVQVAALGMSLTLRTRSLAIYAWLTAILNVALNFALIPSYGIVGSAWATTISYLFLTLGYGISSQRLWPIAYERRRILGAVAAILVFALAARHLPDLPLIEVIPLKICYIGVFIFSLFVVRSLDGRETAALRAVILHRRTTP